MKTRGSCLFNSYTKKGGQTLSDPHEIKLPMAEHQAARGVLTKRPLWPPE